MPLTVHLPILQIMTATIAYGRSPSFTRYATGQPSTFNDILRALDPIAFAELRDTGPLEAVPGGIIIGRA